MIKVEYKGCRICFSFCSVSLNNKKKVSVNSGEGKDSEADRPGFYSLTYYLFSVGSWEMVYPLQASVSSSAEKGLS